METAGHWVAWFANWAMWLQAVWLLVACAIAIPWIIWDEFRYHQATPKPAEVLDCANRLMIEHGQDAHRVVGEAICEARLSGDLKARRFLAAVTDELCRRLTVPAEDGQTRNA